MATAEGPITRPKASSRLASRSMVASSIADFTNGGAMLLALLLVKLMALMVLLLVLLPPPPRVSGGGGGGGERGESKGGRGRKTRA